MSPKLHWHILINLPFICRTLYGATDEEIAHLRAQVDEVRPHNYVKAIQAFQLCSLLGVVVGNAITHPLSLPIYKI